MPQTAAEQQFRLATSLQSSFSEFPLGYRERYHGSSRLARGDGYSLQPNVALRYAAPKLKETGARTVVPADPQLVAGLAGRYQSKELGEIALLKKDGVTTFDFGEWKSAVASRKNDDGTVSFITIDPTNSGFEFVVGERSGKRVLVIRDGQHEYVFTEADLAAKSN